MDHVCGGIARRGIKNASQTNEFPGRWQSGQSQQAVNLPPSGYGGSNPPLPTNLSVPGTRGLFGWRRYLFGGKRASRAARSGGASKVGALCARDATRARRRE
jgi:hypothetical protein